MWNFIFDPPDLWKEHLIVKQPFVFFIDNAMIHVVIRSEQMNTIMYGALSICKILHGLAIYAQTIKSVI